jgi:glycosyltransferase involved in cell wall biosynthesis
VKIIRKEQIDIVHLHGYGSSNFGLLAARITGTKAIVQEHFVDPSIPLYQIPFDVILASSAAKGIAVSRSVKEFMVQRRYFSEKQVEVIYNGAPLGEFKRVAGEKIDEIRDKYSIPRDYWVVGSVGRLDTQKGITYLIAAAEKLLKKELKIKFLIVGDGPLLSALRAQCADVGIANNVIFPGYCENIPLMQSLMHIQVFPSLWEGTPLTLIEAMSMGLAIVSTPVDGLGEILRHEENALIVPPKEDDLLAVAIERMIQDSSVRKQLAQRAADDSKNYDIQIAVDRIQHVYEECLAEVL